MDNNELNMMALQLSQIKLPESKELITTNCKWVRFGDDNHFDYFLQTLKDGAPLHNAILTSKIQQAFAEGLVFDDDRGNLNMKLFLSHCNSEESLNDLYYKLLSDLIVFGAFYVEVIWDASGKLASLYHLPYCNIRSGRINPETHRVEEYFYCEDWFKVYQIGYTPIKVYNTDNRTGRQIFAYRDYQAFRKYYTLPDYISALDFIAMEREVGNYGLSLLRNQFSSTAVINFRNGIPDEEKQQEIKRRVQDQLCGTDNAGKLLVTFSPDGDSSPEINTIQSGDAAEQYIQLQNTILQNVLSGHRVVSPLLVGIRGDGQGLGNNANEIETAHQLFYSSVIKPYQDKVLKVLNRLMYFLPNYNGCELMATTTSPITFTFSENTLTQILTEDELREMIGYCPKNKPNEE